MWHDRRQFLRVKAVEMIVCRRWVGVGEISSKSVKQISDCICLTLDLMVFFFFFCSQRTGYGPHRIRPQE